MVKPHDQILNPYGDKLFLTDGMHGANIASQRMDDLDKRYVSGVNEWICDALYDGWTYGRHFAAPFLVVYDLGCGDGAGGFHAFANDTFMVFTDLNHDENLSQKIKNQPHASFLQRDLSGNLCLNPLGNTIDVVYSQRFIHYLRYSQALALMKKLRECGTGLVYISASGIGSELGDDYVGKGVDIEHRFAFLRPDRAGHHSIKTEVCLYSMDDLVRLMEEAGFELIDVWPSPFGNIKGIFRADWKKDIKILPHLTRPVYSSLDIVFRAEPEELGLTPQAYIDALRAHVRGLHGKGSTNEMFQRSARNLLQFLDGEDPEIILKRIRSKPDFIRQQLLRERPSMHYVGGSNLAGGPD